MLVPYYVSIVSPQEYSPQTSVQLVAAVAPAMTPAVAPASAVTAPSFGECGKGGGLSPGGGDVGSNVQLLNEFVAYADCGVTMSAPASPFTS
ncbi:hypothetical protein ACOMHN_012675 [Nucella lapillus]